MADAEVILPTRVVRALQATTFFDRHDASEGQPRVMVQLPISGVTAWIAGSPESDAAAIQRGFPELSDAQLIAAASTLRAMFKNHLRQRRIQRRRAGSWVSNW